MKSQYLKCHKLLDVTGLNCPLPLLKTKLALEDMHDGELLLVKTTDPHALIDFKVFAIRSTHQLLNQEKKANEYHFVIRCCHSSND